VHDEIPGQTYMDWYADDESVKTCREMSLCLLANFVIVYEEL
jgi:hypothetical protein